MSNAVLYYTHFVSDAVKAELQSLQQDLDSDFSLFAVGYCQTKFDLDELSSEGVQIRPYERQDLQSLPYVRQLQNVNWKTLRGNPDLAVMRFFRGNPSFEHYWIIEYDVRFSGSWKDIFNDLKRSSAALLCSHITSLTNNPGWMHWGTFSSFEEPVGRENIVRGFLPFARLSRALVQGIDERCRRGWTGHPEVLWPTIARSMGLSVEEIGGAGTLVPNERKGKYYYSCLSPSGLFLSTFGAWPSYSSRSNFHQAGPPNLLWHPVKE